MSFCIFVFFTKTINAQLGFCSGSKGDPIFHEDFGSGSGTGNPLAAGITNYTYVVGDPQDGQYTISDQISQQIGSWHNSLPSTTVSNGRALIVNADYTAGLFYQTPISGLCENASYEFSAYLMNIFNAASGVNKFFQNVMTFMFFSCFGSVQTRKADFKTLVSTHII